MTELFKAAAAGSWPAALVCVAIVACVAFIYWLICRD